jgi:Xaa-Pro aminopeptidase
MDFGAEYANYAADLSRTIPVNGSFNKRQRELYGATLHIYNEACKLFKLEQPLIKSYEVCKLWEEDIYA